MRRKLYIYSFVVLNIFFNNFLQAQTTNLENNIKPEHSIKMSVDKIELLGSMNKVFIKLNNIKTQKPVTLSDLKMTNAQKINFFIIDDSLEDYVHIHPNHTHLPGIYQFDWQPKKKGNYKIWVGLFPIASDQQEYDMTDLKKNSEIKVNINKNEFFESKVEGITFKLSFDSYPLTVNNSSMGKISIVDKMGQPFQQGVLKDIVFIHEDLKTITQIYSLEENPHKCIDQGCPELQFHIAPNKKGFIKLFVQVNIKGKDYYIPFGLRVE